MRWISFTKGTLKTARRTFKLDEDLFSKALSQQVNDLKLSHLIFHPLILHSLLTKYYPNLNDTQKNELITALKIEQSSIPAEYVILKHTHQEITSANTLPDTQPQKRSRLNTKIETHFEGLVAKYYWTQLTQDTAPNMNDHNKGTLVELPGLDPSQPPLFSITTDSHTVILIPNQQIHSPVISYTQFHNLLYTDNDSFREILINGSISFQSLPHDINVTDITLRIPDRLKNTMTSKDGVESTLSDRNHEFKYLSKSIQTYPLRKEQGSSNQFLLMQTILDNSLYGMSYSFFNRFPEISNSLLDQG